MREPDLPALTILRVIIVDDSEMVGAGLAALLAEEDGVAVAGRAASDAEAIMLMENVKPDVAVLNLELPGARLAALLRRLKAGECPPCLIVLSHYSLQPLEALCLQAGADYFLLNTSELGRLPSVFDAIRSSRPPRRLEVE